MHCIYMVVFNLGEGAIQKGKLLSKVLNIETNEGTSNLNGIKYETQQSTTAVAGSMSSSIDT